MSLSGHDATSIQREDPHWSRSCHSNVRDQSCTTQHSRLHDWSLIEVSKISGLHPTNDTDGISMSRVKQPLSLVDALALVLVGIWFGWATSISSQVVDTQWYFSTMKLTFLDSWGWHLIEMEVMTSCCWLRLCQYQPRDIWVWMGTEVISGSNITGFLRSVVRR